MLRTTEARKLPAQAGELVQGPGGLVIDLGAYQVRGGDGSATPLTRTECQLLRCLASVPGHVISRPELMLQVQAQRGRTLDVYVCRLRRKLGDERGMYIQTVRKIGYRLNPAPARAEGTVMSS